MNSTGTVVQWRHYLWALLLVTASLGLSNSLACATPLVAFGVVAALTLPPRNALGLMGALWLADQVFGYAVLNYPRTATSVAWGLLMGVAAVLATLIAQRVRVRMDRQPVVVAAPAAFLVAFVAYQIVLVAPALVGLGGLGGFTPAVIARVFVINAGTLASLVMAHYAWLVVGLGARSGLPIPKPPRSVSPNAR